MIEYSKDNINKKEALDNLLTGDGVILIKDVYSKKQIDEARLIVNKFA